jgi:diguanylate cyclase (GGDEF)-like protein
MKILLVEDSAAVVMVMTRRLSSFGHEVLLAINGLEAVNMFRDCAPDLVLMDIEMPVMNGFEAASRIRAVEATQQWAWTPIIFLTASDTVENLITAIEAGGDDFMTKAVPEPVLQAKMKAMARIATLRQRLSAANHKLEAMASSDGLTGLCNRRSMDERVDLSFAQASTLGAPFGLVMLDIDNFKKYNDHYGHQQGDDCLRKVASAIGASVDDANASGLTTGAFAARYGGEEFAVVLPGVPDAALQQIANSIVQAVRQLGIPHKKNDSWQVVTISVGGACRASASGKVVDIFRAADAQLYRAKENGRNRVEISPEQ